MGTGKNCTSPTRPGTALERKFSTFENYQVRVAEEGEQIINVKLREKITELDELCMSGKFNISRLAEIREYTNTSVQGYLDEVKRMGKKEAEKQGGGNPLLQLLAGGMGGGADAGVEGEEGEEMYNPEDDLEAEEIAMPKKLLLSRMGLDEDNKINLKLSLELETPEIKKKKSQEKIEEKSESKKRDLENEEEAETEEPESKKAKRSTRSSKRGKKGKKSSSPEEEEADEAKPEEKEAEKQESSMSVTEGEKSESKKSKKSEDDEEEEEDAEPILPSHPEIYQLSTGLRRHIDVILDWITTIQQWIQSGMTKNKNIGGADIRTEIQNSMLEELAVAEQQLAAHKEIMAAYYISRAAVLEKYVQNPQFEDYRNFLVDEDEKQFVQLRSIVIGMRNTTVNLFDGLTKESETIFNQGGSSKQDNYAAFSMY